MYAFSAPSLGFISTHPATDTVMTSAPNCHQRTGLPSLPYEIYNEITRYLGRKDLIALSYVSKAVRILTQDPLYASLRIRSKSAFSGVLCSLAKNPHLAEAPRKLWVGKHAPWWSLDLLRSFRILQKFVFRPEGLSREHPRHMIRTLADGGWIKPSLVRCKDHIQQYCHHHIGPTMLTSNAGSIELFYNNAKDVEGAVLDQLICTLLTAPSLEVLSATYARDLPESDPLDEHYRPPSFSAYRLPALPTSRCTDLRELHIRWDGLSLYSLSLLLQMPRNLEILHLHFSTSCYYNPFRGVSMNLNEALKPVAHSLRELEIFPVEDYKEFAPPLWVGWRGDIDVWWGEGGLRELKKLEFLAIPSDSWEYHEDRGREIPGLLEGPETLVRLRLLGAQLVYTAYLPLIRDEEVSPGVLPQMNSNVGLYWNMRFQHNRYYSVLRDLLGFISRAPQLRYIEVHSTPRSLANFPHRKTFC